MREFLIIGIILPLFFISINAVYATAPFNDRMSLVSSIEDNQNNNLECGSIIHEDVKLTADLDCISDGLLILAEDGLTIDLNGHSIIGPGEKSGKIGINIKDSEDIRIVGNGTIKNYQAGINIDTSMDIEISNLFFQDNELGVFFTSSKNSKLSNSDFQTNAIGTSTTTGRNIIISNNTYNSNDLAGITIVNSMGNTISDNNVNGSVNGIFFDGQSTDNIIENNTAYKNRGVDMNNGNGLPITVNENKFANNKCDTSAPLGLCAS